LEGYERMENLVEACMITVKGEPRIVRLTSIEDTIEEKGSNRYAVLVGTINGCAIYRELFNAKGG
jgi:hypothetical protein